jgi:uncharacterized protein
MGKHLSAQIALTLLWVCLAKPQASGQEPEQPPAGEYVPRAQDPKPPFPYSSENVSLTYPEAPGVKLDGTFTRPKTEGPVPAVLLLSSAGPQDRDETMAGHKPFLVLADYLTRHGIAVLRMDDRGTGQSEGDYAKATTRDFAMDASASFNYLTKRHDVDVKRLGLIGHGEGAIAAAMVAASNPQVGFVVLLNGTAVSGEEVLLAQTQRAELAAGVTDDQIDADARIGSGIYKMVRDGRSAADMEKALANVPEEYKQYAEPWKKQVPKLQSPWLKFFLSYDPSVALEKIQCPVLAIFADKDTTIDPKQNASAMKKAFSRGHNKNVKIKSVPDLNYLFQKAKTGLPVEYATIEETISPSVLDMIESFISKETTAA